MRSAYCASNMAILRSLTWPKASDRVRQLSNAHGERVIVRIQFSNQFIDQCFIVADELSLLSALGGTAEHVQGGRRADAASSLTA